MIAFNRMKESNLSRRDLLKYGVASFGLATLGSAFAQEPATSVQQPSAEPFPLPSLPYDVEALEPYIDAETMTIHHGKHHAAYVAKLNEAIAKYPELGQRTIERLLSELDTLPEDVRTVIRNNGGGHHNHSLFWMSMKKDGGGRAKGEIAVQINKNFGSFDAFKESFTKMALSVFGSGWVWLTLTPEKKLALIQMPNQDSPLCIRHSPLLGLDVWEHAYYLKYQNRRADYVAAWFNLINWDEVENLWMRSVKSN